MFVVKCNNKVTTAICKTQTIYTHSEDMLSPQQRYEESFQYGLQSNGRHGTYLFHDLMSLWELSVFAVCICNEYK
jgi:hypothetical protein